jgi:hypothetical protein
MEPSKAKKKKERVLISFDYALKRLLRHKANFEILEGFLSELLYRQIKIKNLLESESNQEDADDKQNRVDLLAEDSLGELIIIEVQYQYEIDFLCRMLYATGKSTTEYLDKGQDYGSIRKVFSINIIYFPLGKGDDYVYHGKTDFLGIHTNNPLLLTEAQKTQFNKETIAELYPEYYILNVEHFDNVAKNTLDEWMYYLKNNAVVDGFTAQGLEQVRQRLDYDKMTPNEQRRYDKEQERKRSWDNVLRSAELENAAKLEAQRKRIEAQNAAISEMDAAISEKDAVISEKDAAISEKDAVISEKDAELEKERIKAAEKEAELEKQIAELKRLLKKG